MYASYVHFLFCVIRFHFPSVLIVINAGVMTFLCKYVVRSGPPRGFLGSQACLECEASVCSNIAGYLSVL